MIFFLGWLTGLALSREPRHVLRPRLKQRIAVDSPLFCELKSAVTPTRKLQKSLWQRIQQRVFPTNAFCELRDQLAPSSNIEAVVLNRILHRIDTAAPVLRRHTTLKWAVAVAVVTLVVRLSPALFIAAPTMAETQAVVVPTKGEVRVSIAGMWQPVTEQLTLEPGMKLRTYNGEASIILHDDGVVRLAGNTTIELHDVSDRLEPSADLTPSLTLYTGQLWVQGLLPAQLRGITVSTRYGLVTVNEGSVSIAEDDYVDVAVYDRRAAIYRQGEPTFFTTGERTRLGEGNVILVKRIPNSDFQKTWADQNLARDAVHRQEIAQLQHERRLAAAGILPNSPLYGVKRFAEAVDIALTFSPQARLQKQLARAETRLNEAAALLAEGETADATLQEYRRTLQEVASGSGNVSLAQYLVQRAMSETTAQVAAVRPGDDAYVLKKTVLETTADLPDDIVSDDVVEGELLLDGLTALVAKTDAGDISTARSVWTDLQPYMVALENEAVRLDPSLHKEAQMLLAFIASELHDAHARGVVVDPELLDDVANFLPPRPQAPVLLTEAEVMEIVQGIRGKIFLYNMKQSRINQFIAEMRALRGHPDQGRILRRLTEVLPNGPERFPDRVYQEIVRLRWEKAAEII